MTSLRAEMKSSLIAAGIAAMALTAGVLAQGERDASPAGTAATEVLGKYDMSATRRSLSENSGLADFEVIRAL